MAPDAEPLPRHSRPPKTPAMPVPSPQIRGRVLVVDDDEAVSRAVSRILRIRGYDVSIARDGELALAALETDCFDVVVSDISMPNMDGIRLLSLIRQRDAHVQVCLMTGDPSPETAASALSHGALKYLLKPLELDQLLDGIEQAIGLTRTARAESEARVASDQALEAPHPESGSCRRS